MNVIQQTAKIDSSRRVLTLERPLPESVSAGLVDVKVFILPSSNERQPVQSVKTAPKDPKRWGRGWSQDSGDTMEAYFERCRADKEAELAAEKRQEEEHACYAGLSS